MSWVPFEIVWDWPALDAFYRLPPHTAYIVDRAVIRFAERGEGHIELVAPYTRLRAGRYDVTLVIDDKAGTICVIRMHRMR